MKSTPCFNPIEAIDPIPPKMMAPEMMYAILRLRKNSMLMFWNQPLEILVLNVKSFPLVVAPSINNLVMKIAVNNEVAIPIIKVNANPLIGPVPNTNKIIAVKPVVMLASKIDDNALEILLPSQIGYIGALGSRRTHEKRVNRLLRKGFTEKEIERINAPIGVDINAKTPKEIALSIMGEIIKMKNGFL